MWLNFIILKIIKKSWNATTVCYKKYCENENIVAKSLKLAD